MQETLIHPKHMSLPQTRAPKCTAEPTVELYRAPRLHNQGTGVQCPFKQGKIPG